MSSSPPGRVVWGHSYSSGVVGPASPSIFLCSHLVAPFPKLMVPLGLQVGFLFFFLSFFFFSRLRLWDATFYVLGVTQAAFSGWVGDLILSAVVLPAPAPRGEDTDHSGWEASRANARGAGTCSSPLERSGIPPAFGPEGVRCCCLIPRSGPATGEPWRRILRRHMSNGEQLTNC